MTGLVFGGGAGGIFTDMALAESESEELSFRSALHDGSLLDRLIAEERDALHAADAQAPEHRPAAGESRP